jgi:hypothetical protein
MRSVQPSLTVVACSTTAGLSLLLVACGSGTPSAPTRYGEASLSVSCATGGADPLRCTSRISHCLPYPCSPAVPGTDLTTQSTWESGDPAVARIVEPGVVAAAGIGDTFIRVLWQSYEAYQTVSVFAGTPPLPTQEIFGSIYDAGKTLADGAITGATVEVIEGFLAGRTATSGVPPPTPPGFFGPFGGPGYYRILGIPAGRYRLRATKSGYLAQEREVMVTTGSPSADFQLSPIPGR